jgi:signal transduction histidine kinase
VTDTATAPLEVRAVLEAIRRAASAVSAAEQTEEALQAIVEALVPEVADVAEVFVVANTGHLRCRARAPVDPLALPLGESDEEGGPSRDSDPPVFLAVRSGVAAVQPHGSGDPSILDGREEPGHTPREFDAVALPLLREDQSVGALWLKRDGGRRYGRKDLDLLQEVGDRISQMLDNNRLRREVRSAQRAKADFLAVVNHELRTPLTAVVGYADLLEAGIPGPVTEKQRRQLVRIKESAWDLLELIDGILGYARYEGEQPELSIRRVDPEDLLQDAVRVVEGAAEEKGLRVQVDAEQPLPTFPTDAEKARRILFHLLSNAVKFTPEGEVRVRIRAEPQWVTFSVTDTGIGIKPEARSSIFEPFWQGERPETRTTRGAGMGLSLAQKLSELLSAEIEVESEVGRGSTFTVRFPRLGPHPALL